ncbi:TetR/AcrR family transcriptional regulator [Microbacterium sp.]|uniref:TetR/AcrR family transcriptional regulator n=1 Tax=Microbacterium sp. TaxID=51671 RepID=UPI00356548FE
MPRVTDDHRRARRDEIARAALRCLERTGIHQTSISDIVEESGLSTGAIYSNFPNKREIMRYIVSDYLFPRLDEIGWPGGVRQPREVLELMLQGFTEDGLPPRIIIQFWAEASLDAELHDDMARTVARLRDTLMRRLLPWARTRATSDTAATALAREHAVALNAIAQGYIAHTAVFGPRDPLEYIESIAAVVA